jgi:S-ribosylhomocysteine lyase
MHSLDESKQIAQNVLDRNIGIMKNSDILLSDEELNKIENGKEL